MLSANRMQGCASSRSDALARVANAGATILAAGRPVVGCLPANFRRYEDRRLRSRPKSTHIFCDPQSSRQRGSNENTTGLLRQ